MRLRVTTSAETPSFVECAVPACQNVTITAIAWRRGQDQVVFTTSDPGRGRAQSLLLWDLASDAVRPIARADGLISGGHGSSLGESCSVGALAAVCVTASADTPPRLERIDLATGERRVLYDPNQDLAQAVGPRAEFLSWTDAKGRTFTGQLFPPASTRPGQAAPLFITYYGCAGYLRGGVGDEWPLASLAGAGIAALCINEPPTDRLNPNQLSRYEAAMSGVEAIVAELGRRGIVDPHRVGMGGLSFGSEVTMWAAMKTDLLAAASMTSPSVTPTYFRFHSLQGPGFRKNLKRAWGLGAPEETPERWRLLSPAFNLDRIHAPLLLQMPEQEYLEASDYFAPLANSATPAEIFVFPNEPHVKFQPRHKLAAYERNLDWFRFWLQGYVDPDPLKADQYARWEAMRARAAAAGQHPGQGRTTG
ncbi:MAG: Atxe2 family lasso peptide isopeptidase [Devosia sp.]|nr:Atxe2 family lasso peptide isopeptidase [Devosia sp.]